MHANTLCMTRMTGDLITILLRRDMSTLRACHICMTDKLVTEERACRATRWVWNGTRYGWTTAACATQEKVIGFRTKASVGAVTMSCVGKELLLMAGAREQKHVHGIRCTASVGHHSVMYSMTHC